MLTRLRMPSNQRLELALTIVGTWGIILFGVLVAPFPPPYNYVLASVDTLIFLLLGVHYLPASRFTPNAQLTPEVPTQPATLTGKELNELTSVESQTWLKEKYPRVWDFVRAVSIITSERDYQRLLAEMELLFGWTDIVVHPETGREILDRESALAIARAILLSKKQFAPRKKRFWE